MPTYLRWIAAITSGITAYFAFSIVTLGIVLGTGRDQVAGAANALVVVGANLTTLLTALAVNDWLIRRYPPRGLTPTDDGEDGAGSVPE